MTRREFGGSAAAGIVVGAGRKAYPHAAAGASDKFEHVVGPEGHRFYAALGWPAFDRLTGWKQSMQTNEKQ